MKYRQSDKFTFHNPDSMGIIIEYISVTPNLIQYQVNCHPNVADMLGVISGAPLEWASPAPHATPSVISVVAYV